MGRTGGSYEQWPFAAGYTGRTAPRAEIDPGAEAWQTHPWAYAERRALLHGELPLWNRHNGLGEPLLSNGQTATFNPLHALVLLNPDSAGLWDFYFLLLRFIAGIFGCYLAFALGAPKELAILAAPFGAVNGIFTIFLNRGDLAAYAIMPAVLYCLVRLRRSPGPGGAVALAIAMAVCLTGGHPEPAFAALFVCGLAALGFCTLSGAPVRRYLAWSGTGAAMAVLITAPYWLPFVARIPQAFSLHTPGSGYGNRPPLLALEWLAPNAFANGMYGLWDGPQNFGFLGCLMGLLALIGATAAFVVPSFRRRALWILGPVVLALRIYGAPLTGWIGHLPLLDRMPFELYGQFPVLYPLGIFGIAGLAALLEAGSWRKAVAVTTAAVVALEILLLAPIYAPGDGVLSPQWTRQLLLDSNLIILAAVLCAASLSQSLGERARRTACALLFIAVTAELASYREHLSERGNPTATPAYANWLQRRQAEEGPFRVMGVGYTLMPNFATAFGLDDVRLCDALLSPEYINFVKRFLQKDLQWQWLLSAQPADGFDLRNPVLDWLNVRYLVGGPIAAVLPTVLETKLRASGHPAWERRVYVIDDVPLPVLYQHPNDEGSVSLRIPADDPFLAFGLAQDPAVWNAQGDGATYEIKVATHGSPSQTVYSRSLDPKHKREDRHWLRDRVDLSHWKGAEITLTLRAWSGDTAADWGGWGDLHWENAAGQRTPGDPFLPIAFRDGTQAYVIENPHAWPRLFAVDQPRFESGPDAVLDRIAALAARVGGPYAVVGADFPKPAWERLCAGGACAPDRPLRPSIGRIVYGTNWVSFEAKVEKPAVLVLSDLLAPGWIATVDGKPEALFHANYLFRGLLVGPGAHTVHMQYRPREWIWAFLLAAGGWLLIAGAIFAQHRKTRIAVSPPSTA